MQPERRDRRADRIRVRTGDRALRGVAAYRDATACLFGDVRIGTDASFWPYCVVRAERNHVEIGAVTSIHEHAMVHIGWTMATIIGAYCTIGHRAVVHGCTIEAACIIGIGATIMESAVIGRGSLVAAHSFVPAGMIAPPGSLVMGTPARIVRAINTLSSNVGDALLYRENTYAYARDEHRAWAAIDLDVLGIEADGIIAVGL